MRKTDLNAIYISERVQETLRPVSVSALTAVVAPMGYGKTTAVNWFLNQRRQTEAAVILRVNIYSDNRFIFWTGQGRLTNGFIFLYKPIHAASFFPFPYVTLRNSSQLTGNLV